MAHPDLNSLFDRLVMFAQQCLVEQSEFLPFAATVDIAGTVNMLAADVGPEEQHAPAAAMIRLLTGGISELAKARKIRAAGICFDALYRAGSDDKPWDAIQCALEHENGESINVFVPYQKRRGQSNIYEKACTSRRPVEFFRRPN